MQCRLHIFDLGLCNRLRNKTFELLNSNGIKMLHNLLQSSILKITPTHRIRKCVKSQIKLNGDDSTLLMKDIGKLMNNLLVIDNMNQKYYDIIASI